MSKKNHAFVHYLTAFLFGLIAVVHLLRLVYKVPVMFGSVNIPLWASWFGVFIAALLSFSLWQTAKK